MTFLESQISRNSGNYRNPGICGNLDFFNSMRSGNSRILLIKNILHLATTSVLSHLWPPKYSLFYSHVWFLYVAYEVLSNSNKYFTFGNQIWSFTSITTYVFFIWKTDFFSFMPITFEVVHTRGSIQNTYAYEMLSDNHKYFYICHNYLFFHIYDHVTNEFPEIACQPGY